MPDEYRILKSLGRGTYGKVYKVERKRDGAILVLKQIALNELTPREQQDVLNEVSPPARDRALGVADRSVTAVCDARRSRY